MAIEIRYPVMSPEAGTQKGTGELLPSMGGHPPGPGGSRPGGGGRPPLQTPVFTPAAHTAARRLDTLENKKVYLVDTGYGGSYQFMQALQQWFKKNMPSVTTIRKRKTGNVFADDTTDLWEEVKSKGHAVVLGVAG
jgi:hypothetical protein